MTLYRVTAQSLEVLSVSAASLRATAQSLEVLTDTWQVRLPKAYGLVVLGPPPNSVVVQKSYALAVLDDGSLPTYDPYWSNTVLLLHGEGSNGGTSFIDSSPSVKTVTANGNASTSTAQFKWGSTSIALDGTGDYLSVADHADWSFGTGPFTIELWARIASVNTQIGFIGQYESGGAAATSSWLFSRNTSLEFRFINAAGTAQTVSSAWTPTANTWYHLAVDRDSGGVIRIYVNGAVLTSATNAGDIRDVATTPLRIGRSTGVAGTDVNGYIDDVRITKGVARYAGGTFAVPLAAYPDYPFISGSGANTLDVLTSTATGTYTDSAVTGTGANTLGTLTSSASGTVTPPEITGTASASLGSLTSSASGAVVPPEITGTGSATLSALTSSASGTLTYSGTAGNVLDALSSSGAAIHAPAITGSSAALLDVLAGAGAGIHLQPIIGVGETTLDGILTLADGAVGIVTWPPPRVRKVYLMASQGRTVTLNATVRH